MIPITRKPWFGPRRFGWGWTPVAWEGWLVTGVIVVLIVVSGTVLPPTARTVAVIALVAVLMAVCYLTGGAPGSTFGRRR